MLLILAAVVLCLIYLVHEFKSRQIAFTLRETLGLDGPPPDFISGNVRLVIEWARKNGLAATPKLSLELRKRYGKTYGIYIGKNLQIVTTDAALVKELFITKFRDFPNRQYFTINAMYPTGDGLLQVGIEGGSHGVGWKEIRSCVSAIFTSGKMKKMHLLFHDHVNAFLECLGQKAKERAGGSVEIYGEYQALTMDMIVRCAFGMSNVDCIGDRKNPIYTRARQFFANFSLRRSTLLIVSIIITPLGILRRFSNFGRPEIKIVDALSVVVKEREEDRAAGKTREIPDLIDLILQENEKRAESGERPMHHDVIVSNCYAFLIAGYETTSTALSYASWLLAANLECQERLREEVLETFGDKGEVDYDRVMKLPYLNAVMLETLRLKPPVVLLTVRESVCDTTLGDMKIPKGVNVVTPVHAMHMNEDHWPEPNSFIPERFLNEKLSSYTNNAYTYMPFGIGPRNCVGARFAEMEFKTVLASVVRGFRFEVDPAEPELETFISSVLQLPLNNRLSLRVEAR